MHVHASDRVYFHFPTTTGKILLVKPRLYLNIKYETAQYENYHRKYDDKRYPVIPLSLLF